MPPNPPPPPPPVNQFENHSLFDENSVPIITDFRLTDNYVYFSLIDR